MRISTDPSRPRARMAVPMAIHAAALTLATFPTPARAGIPEPDLVWYGRILSTQNGQQVRVTSGMLAWEVTPAAGGATMVFTTVVTNINDQFSYILRVPCETRLPADPPQTSVVSIATPPVAYTRVKATLDGKPLTLSAAPTQFTPGMADRGRPERVDLLLSDAADDTDGDGLADAWELQHFGNLNAGPNDDPDGDGMSNLQEYRAGTHPKDPQSRFAFIEMESTPGGLWLRWASQPNRKYRVLRAPSLLTPASEYQVIGQGITSTPPVNEFLDTDANSTGSAFYLLQVEN
jgi:hypothetical protein